jgi:hypothetical protein
MLRPLFPCEYIRCFSFDRLGLVASPEDMEERKFHAALGNKLQFLGRPVPSNPSYFLKFRTLLQPHTFVSYIRRVQTDQYSVNFYGLIAMGWNKGVQYSWKARNFLHISTFRDAQRSTRPPAKWASPCLTPGIFSAGSWSSLTPCPLQNFMVRCLPLKNVIRVNHTEVFSS